MTDATWAAQLEQLAPYAKWVRVTRAPGQRTYIELEAPPDIVQDAMQVTFECHNDGAPMHPFRERNGEGGRQWERGGVFFAASCKRPSCSRAAGASVALNLAADFFDGTLRALPKAPPACPNNAFTGLHIPDPKSPARCLKCGGMLL